MEEDSVPEATDGVGVGVLSLFLGFPVAVLFNAFVQGQDLVVLFLVLVGFGGCIVYGETMVAMPTGVAFGAGLLMTGLAAMDAWPICLGGVAVSVSLAKYALANPEVGALEESPGLLNGDSAV